MSLCWSVEYNSQSSECLLIIENNLIIIIIIIKYLILLDELYHGVDLPGLNVAEGDERALPAGAGQHPAAQAGVCPAHRVLGDSGGQW